MAWSAISALRPGTTQAIAYTGTAASSAVFGTETYCVRIASNSNCHVLVFDTTNVIAATVANAMYLPQNWVDYIIVTPGQKISVIQAATDGNVTAHAGTLLITEMA